MFRWRTSRPSRSGALQRRSCSARGWWGLRGRSRHAQVAVQAVGTGAAVAGGLSQAGHVQVLPAVAVEVAHRRRQPAVGPRYPGRGRVVGKGAVAVVEVERVHRAAAAKQEEVLPAVAVEVADRAAAGHVRHGVVQRAPLRGQPGRQPRRAEAQLGHARVRARRHRQHRGQYGQDSSPVRDAAAWPGVCGPGSERCAPAASRSDRQIGACGHPLSGICCPHPHRLPASRTTAYDACSRPRASLVWTGDMACRRGWRW